MLDSILLVALLTTAVLGAAIFRAHRSERRRMKVESRLSTIATTATTPSPAPVSLRRPRPQRKALPMVLSDRLEFASAATGNFIRLWHLVAAGIPASRLDLDADSALPITTVSA